MLYIEKLRLLRSFSAARLSALLLLLSCACGEANKNPSVIFDGGSDACIADCEVNTSWVPQTLGPLYDVSDDGSLLFADPSLASSVLFPDGSGWSAAVGVNPLWTPMSNQGISSDGRTLAVKGGNGVIGGEDATYFFADRNGTLELAIPPGTPLANNPFFFRAPRLSSDGQRMIFSDLEQIWVVDRGSAPVPIGEKVTANGLWWISESGDVALASAENTVVGPTFPLLLHDIDAGTSETIELVDSQGAALMVPGGVRAVFMSPDLRKLLICWSAGGEFDVEVYDRDTKTMTSLMAGLDESLGELGGNLVSVSAFDATPDLRFIAAAANLVMQGQSGFTIVTARLYVVDTTTGDVYNASVVRNPSEQTSGNTFLREMALRPDGQQVFFNNDYYDNQSILKTVTQRTDISSWEKL